MTREQLCLWWGRSTQGKGGDNLVLLEPKKIWFLNCLHLYLLRCLCQNQLKTTNTTLVCSWLLQLHKGRIHSPSRVVIFFFPLIFTILFFYRSLQLDLTNKTRDVNPETIGDNIYQRHDNDCFPCHNRIKEFLHICPLLKNRI